MMWSLGSCVCCYFTHKGIRRATLVDFTHKGIRRATFGGDKEHLSALRTAGFRESYSECN